MLIGISLLIVGLVGLTAGAELLVRGAASLALRLGVSSLAVGLTVVAFGTSMPEMVVSVRAALAGNSQIAIGNVVGSNIFNIAVILGLAALICPIPCHTKIVRREAPLMIAATVLLMALVWWSGREAGGELAGTLGRGAGLLLVGLAIAYTVITYLGARRESAELSQLEPGLPTIGTEQQARSRSWWLDFVLIAAGLVLLALGAEWLVGGAVRIARWAGLSELVIGLTIVAAGTSMPELATSAVAAFRRQPDISVGNVVGSNLFNILGILGVTAAIQPMPIPANVFARDLPIALLVAVLCLPLMYTGSRLSRWEGLVLLALYGFYLALLL